MGSVRWAAIAGVAFLAACATTERGAPAYRPVVGGKQAIYLTGYTQVRQPAQPPYFVPSQTVTLVPVEDGQCTLRNDKGAWETGLPGVADVTTGGALVIECRKEGFKPYRQTLSCSSPKGRGALEGAMGALTLLGPQGAALAALAAPGILIGAVAAGSVIGSEASARAAGPEGRDTCDYAITSIAVYLWPEER